jgi:hypothetical protein
LAGLFAVRVGTEMPTVTEHIVAMYYNTVPLNADNDPYVKKHQCLLNLTNLLMSRKRADEEYTRASSAESARAQKILQDRTVEYNKEYTRCKAILEM